ncbi:MAG: hypothetical protein WCI74_04705 [Actinomycetes bacterium]
MFIEASLPLPMRPPTGELTYLAMTPLPRWWHFRRRARIRADNERILYRNLDVAVSRLLSRLNAGDSLPDALATVAIQATDPVTQTSFAALGNTLRTEGQWALLADRLQMGWPTGQRQLNLPLKRNVKYSPPQALRSALESCEPTQDGFRAALTLYCAGRSADLAIEPAPAATDLANLVGWLASIRTSIRDRVDPRVSVRVDTICVLVGQVLPHADNLSPGSRERHILIRTATDYLPQTLGPYLSMPQSYRDQAQLAGGQTATEALCAQLDLIAKSIEDIRSAVLQADKDRLLANGVFLQDALGQSQLSLPPPQVSNPTEAHPEP